MYGTQATHGHIHNTKYILEESQSFYTCMNIVPFVRYKLRYNLSILPKVDKIIAFWANFANHLPSHKNNNLLSTYYDKIKFVMN